MKLTTFTFFKNTPLTDFQNTILFENNEQRDQYFDYNFDRIIFNDMKFNFMRDRGEIRINVPYNDMLGINYCRFKSDFEDVTYYAFVMDYEYINDNTTKVSLLIDGLMTFCQGDTLSHLTNLSVTRSHLSRREYNKRIYELKNNDDVIATHSRRYTHNEKFLFDDLDVLIQVACSLTADFGNVDDPKIVTSSGMTFDKISSPVNLYSVSKDRFRELMNHLSDFPWITQNIRSVSLVPSILLKNKTTNVDPRSYNFDGLYELTHGQTTQRNEFDSALLKISKSMYEMYEMFGLDPDEDKHLLRNEYTTTEVYTFNGKELFVDNGQLSEEYGLDFATTYVMGYHNEVAIYINNYKAVDNVEGSYLNHALFLNEFNDVPIMIDNYNLALSKSAQQRELAESKLASNRISNITDPGGDSKQRFYDAASLATNLNPMNFFSKFVDEHEFYRQQKAQHKDLAMETNTVTQESHQNSLQIANDIYGIHVKHAQPEPKEWEKIKKYYKLFGHELNDENSTVDPRQMTVCDYVQFKGQYMIEGTDISILEMLKAQFENGVRFWHYNQLSNPMQQNVMLNKMR